MSGLLLAFFLQLNPKIFSATYEYYTNLPRAELCSIEIFRTEKGTFATLRNYKGFNTTRRIDESIYLQKIKTLTEANLFNLTGKDTRRSENFITITAFCRSKKNSFSVPIETLNSDHDGDYRIIERTFVSLADFVIRDN